MLKAFRLTHLYLGLFIAPAVIFFAFTGALQTFSLHETTPGSDYKPAKWEIALGQLHKKQTLSTPQRRTPPLDAAKPPASPKPAPPTPSNPPAPQKKHLPMKIFFLLVSISLLTSTLTGIYMAFKYRRDRWMITGLLLAGFVIPLLLLRF